MFVIIGTMTDAHSLRSHVGMGSESDCLLGHSKSRLRDRCERREIWRCFLVTSSTGQQLSINARPCRHRRALTGSYSPDDITRGWPTCMVQWARQVSGCTGHCGSPKDTLYSRQNTMPEVVWFYCKHSETKIAVATLLIRRQTSQSVRQTTVMKRS